MVQFSSKVAVFTCMILVILGGGNAFMVEINATEILGLMKGSVFPDKAGHFLEWPKTPADLSVDYLLHNTTLRDSRAQSAQMDITGNLRKVYVKFNNITSHITGKLSTTIVFKVFEDTLNLSLSLSYDLIMKGAYVNLTLDIPELSSKGISISDISVQDDNCKGTAEYTNFTLRASAYPRLMSKLSFWMTDVIKEDLDWTLCRVIEHEISRGAESQAVVVMLSRITQAIFGGR